MKILVFLLLQMTSEKLTPWDLEVKRITWERSKALQAE